MTERRCAAAPAAGEGLGLWTYGVLDGDAAGPSARRGVDPAHDVELIRHAGLAAIVSPVPLDVFGELSLHESLEDLERLERLARVHNGVLHEALHHGGVVPFRICTIYESAARVKEMLAREGAQLTAVLQGLHGMAEWGVKAYAVGAAGGDAVASEPSSGTAYLLRKRAQRDAAVIAQQALDTAVERVHARLRERAAEAVLNPPRHSELTAHRGEMVLNAAYLVAEVEAEGFRALVADLADRHRRDGVELELSGPWPAYNFSAAVAR
jgi:hypothetical protein